MLLAVEDGVVVATSMPVEAVAVRLPLLLRWCAKNLAAACGMVCANCRVADLVTGFLYTVAQPLFIAMVLF
jgi:hypothetical protein